MTFGTTIPFSTEICPLVQTLNSGLGSVIREAHIHHAPFGRLVQSSSWLMLLALD